MLTNTRPQYSHVGPITIPITTQSLAGLNNARTFLESPGQATFIQDLCVINIFIGLIEKLFLKDMKIFCVYHDAKLFVTYVPIPISSESCLAGLNNCLPHNIHILIPQYICFQILGTAKLTLSKFDLTLDLGRSSWSL